MRLRLLIIPALALTLLTQSCLGPNRAFTSINNWNASLSNHDWVNELVFLGLWFVPVYPLAMLGDIVVFNTVGYWSGENPINDSGPFPDTFSYEKE